MPVLTPIIAESSVYFDKPQVVSNEVPKEYQTALPFPHAVFDDFLPSEVIQRLSDEFGGRNQEHAYERNQERFKYTYNPDSDISPFCKSVFYAFNSRHFIKWLEQVTGIEKLIPDPLFTGGGFHETRRGGHLSVHADFNLHKQLNLLRRVNVLIYLNDDWSEEFGGNLELWDEGMSQAVQKVSPLMNRCVVFSTTETSYHGHPEPLNCPEDRSRRSIALYYYTSSPSIFQERKVRTTDFKVRPESEDKQDFRTKLFDLILDLTPPIISRNALKVLSKQR